MANIYQERIQNLRKRMREHELGAYIIFSGDFHGSEYVSDHFKCREYMSGFTGSAGTLVVNLEEARLWTDGRYFLQAERELEGSGIILMRDGMDGVDDIFTYLHANLTEYDAIGFDGRTVSIAYAQDLQESMRDIDPYYETELDLVGELWTDRPPMTAEPVWILDSRFVGRHAKDKLASLRKAMREKDAASHILTSLDDIAYLYNLRGSDIAYNPVFMAYTIVTAETAYLYVHPSVVGESVREYLSGLGVELRDYEAVFGDLKTAALPVMLDESSTSVAIREALPKGAEVIAQKNPTMLAKACKTPTEMENERQAHIKDGAALTKLIYWLKHHPDVTKLTELDVCERLLELRKEQENFIEESFAPIVATGANGAIIHYEPTEATNTAIQKNTFLLMDTGGQYLEGTTDVTRTIAVGTVTEEMKRLYTAVLKGNLRLASTVFRNAAGVNLDILARTPLWELGYDYRHGTGHGVGYLLNVHEGPQRISMKPAKGEEPAQFSAGMLTSDEPGVYIEGAYGIRLENLMLCVKKNETEYGTFLGFETVTMVPYDKSCIRVEDLDANDLAALRDYYAAVREKLAPCLTDEENAWLREETEL